MSAKTKIVVLHMKELGSLTVEYLKKLSQVA